MSVELQKLRGELLREALLKGITRAADVPAPWSTQIEQARLERWFKKLYSAPDKPMPVRGRLVNHFMLGADPEFVFSNGLQRTDARAAGLKAGPAFGADNNGRLCEIRPAPSRSALAVLASMWLGMRWMVVYHPAVLNFNWRSGGYFDGDGLGGHVHFGRKRAKLRDREVAVLDRLTHLQFTAGIFDREEGRMRVRHSQGAPAGQPYGALSDIRLQPHGYEYRTMPSWVDNPWLAYFNLVLAKLAVAFPDLVAPLTASDAGLTAEQARAQLRLLVSYYTALDDDARLAAAILARRGFPQHAQGLDFKGAWGVYAGGPLGNKAEATPCMVFPETVQATEAEEQELALSMFEGRPPELTALKPTWTPSTLPPGYTHMIAQVDTKVAPGLGEFAMGLVVHKDVPFQLLNSGHNHYAFHLPEQAAEEARRFELAARVGVPVAFDLAGWDMHMNASKDYALEDLLYARRVLLESGIFPFWGLQDVKADSLQRWKAARALKLRERKSADVLFEASNGSVNGSKKDDISL